MPKYKKDTFFLQQIQVDFLTLWQEYLFYGKLLQGLNIFLLKCCLLYSVVKFFALFSKSDGGFQWNGLTIYVLTNKMNISAQLKDREPRLHVLLFLIILEIILIILFLIIQFFSCIWMWCLCLFFHKSVSFFRQNPIKFCKTMRNEKPTVRPWQRQWNMSHTVKPWELRGLKNMSSGVIKYINKVIQAGWFSSWWYLLFTVSFLLLYLLSRQLPDLLHSWQFCTSECALMIGIGHEIWPGLDMMVVIEAIYLEMWLMCILQARTKFWWCH